MTTIAARQSASQRIVPGEFWYAYGSSAIDLSLFDSTSNTSRSYLYICDSAEISGNRLNQNPHHVNSESTVDVGRLSRDTIRVAVAICAIIALVLFSVLSVFGMETSKDAGGTFTSDEAVVTEVIAVGPGDTLWDIAEEHPIAGMTTRNCVKWIMSENGLQDTTLHVGQAIVVPSFQ